MKNKIKLMIFPIIITILKMIFLVPFQVTGGFENINEIQYLNIIHATSIVEFDCADCFNYQILFKPYILEGLITLVLSSLITLIVVDIINKKKNK